MKDVYPIIIYPPKGKSKKIKKCTLADGGRVAYIFFV